MNKTLTKQRNIRKPAGFETKEMEGYFRLPKKAAAIAIVKKLSGTQLRLWLYLMMEDPFADLTATGEKIYHYIPSPVEIALKIGANQETVEKDMRVLKKLGLYDYRATGWEGYNLSAAEADAEADRLRQRKKATETLTAKGGGLNNPQESLNKPLERLNNPQESLNKPPERLNSLLETPEPLPQGEFKTPHTSSDYSDFLKSLSEGERETFKNYCESRASQEAKKPKAWIRTAWKDLWDDFQAAKTDATRGKKAKKVLTDWRDHPNYDHWLYEAFSRRYEWANEAVAKDDRYERIRFIEWCEETKAFSVFDGGVP